VVSLVHARAAAAYRAEPMRSLRQQKVASSVRENAQRCTDLNGAALTGWTALFDGVVWASQWRGQPEFETVWMKLTVPDAEAT